ncbi:MAG: signal peptidase II [Eubacteriales bacterium]|nr:signal peptidase II [Eubacteriales bacterium]
MAKYISWIIVALDQLSKFLVRKFLPLGTEILIIPGFFKLQQSRNKGAAWGFLSEHSWGIYLLSGISLIVAVLLFFYSRKIKSKHLYLAIRILLGGAVGNLIDRLLFAEVVDFLAFKFGSYNFPNFNLADTAISLAAVYLFVLILFKQDEFNELVAE